MSYYLHTKDNVEYYIVLFNRYQIIKIDKNNKVLFNEFYDEIMDFSQDIVIYNKNGKTYITNYEATKEFSYSLSSTNVKSNLDLNIFYLDNNIIQILDYNSNTLFLINKNNLEILNIIQNLNIGRIFKNWFISHNKHEIIIYNEKFEKEKEFKSKIFNLHTNDFMFSNNLLEIIYKKFNKLIKRELVFYKYEDAVIKNLTKDELKNIMVCDYYKDKVIITYKDKYFKNTNNLYINNFNLTKIIDKNGQTLYITHSSNPLHIIYDNLLLVENAIINLNDMNKCELNLIPSRITYNDIKYLYYYDNTVFLRIDKNTLDRKGLVIPDMEQVRTIPINGNIYTVFYSNKDNLYYYYDIDLNLVEKSKHIPFLYKFITIPK